MKRSSMFTTAVFIAMGLAAVWGSISNPGTVYSHEDPPEDKQDPATPMPIPHNTPDCEGHGDPEGDGPGPLGTLVCDGEGNLIVCTFPDNLNPPGPEDPGHDDIMECVRKHEEHHVTDGKINCDGVDPGEKPEYGSEDDKRISECEAFHVELQCINSKLSKLDEAYQQQGNVYTLDQYQRVQHLTTVRDDILDRMDDEYRCFDEDYPGDPDFFED